MKRQHAKINPSRLISLAAAVVFLLVPVSAGAANPSKAYFKSFGADVMSGGWFVSNGSCDTSTTSNYQDPSFSNASIGYAADNRTGGILTYAQYNIANNYSTGGASSQYAAFANGSIEGSTPSTNSWGFYSAGAQAASGNTLKTALTFANTGITSAYWGGQYEGGVRQGNCIPDYYSKVPTNPPPPGLSSCSGTLCSSTASGTYSASAGAGTTFSLTNGAVNVAAGTKITIYVNGDVYIGDNITYTLDKENDVPKFALVVKGSIYIGSGVSQLDGLYIAQPADTTAQAVQKDDGDIWTCHPNSVNTLLYTDVGQCTNKLTINGALIAKQVNFTRTKGDVGSASTSEDTLPGAQSSSNIGEVINYTPAMEIGGPFFNQSPPTSLPIDSLISLPPIF